jgi:hypothetical protein
MKREQSGAETRTSSRRGIPGARGALLALTVASIACAEGDLITNKPYTPVPTTNVLGSVDVRTVTTGQDVDPNGYTIVVNDVWAYDHEPTSIGANGRVLLRNLTAVTHLLQLYDVAPNCTGAQLEDRPVVVKRGGVTVTEFHVTCSKR